MAIKLKDGTILRNLEEQVQYLTNYHDVNQGLAQWGIRVVGQVADVAELPNPATYKGEYGDAYAVGTEAPFNFYIWTRAAIVGDPDYWFPFGEISIVGPQGPQGPKGDKGDTGESTEWYAGSSRPVEASSYNTNDLWLDTVTGDVYQVVLGPDNVTKVWGYRTNIRGPQGPQGPQGPKGADGKDGAPGPQGPQGDVGGFINIWGIVANTDQLPTPASLNNPTVAYLVEHAGGSDATNDHYDLYIQVGENSSTALWTNVGPFNAATLVTSGGVGLNVWDADSKLDRNTAVTQYNQLYAKAADGGEGYLNVTKEVVGDAAVQRRNDGHILVPTVTASSNINYAANKNYVDTNFLAKQTAVTQRNQAYVNTSAGNNEMLDIDSGISANTLVRRNNNGDIIVSSNPNSGSVAINKGYADNSYVFKPSSSSPSGVIRFNAADGTTSTYGIYQSSPGAQQIPLAKNGGRITTNTPTENLDCANKAYVDNNSVVSIRYTFESLDDQTLLVVYLTMNRNQYEALEPYEYFINKDITSSVKGLPCFCERLGTLSTLYWDPSNDIFKCSGTPDDEYELIQTETM